MMPPPHPITAMSRQQGFAMLEVLISLLVLSVGVLGMAALQIAAMKFSHESYERSQANALLSDYADLMRTNPEGAAAGAYNLTAGTDPTAPTTNCDVANCDAAQLGAFDAHAWAQQAKAMLPGVRMSSRCLQAPCTRTSLQQITVLWPEEIRNGVIASGCPAAAADGAAAGFACVTLRIQP